MIPNDQHIHINERTLERIFYDYFQKLTYQAGETLGEHLSSKDIVLEVFQKLWEGRAALKFSDEKKLAGYLRLLTQNACIDHIRKRNTRKKANLHLAYRWEVLQMPEDSVLATVKSARLQEQTIMTLSAALEKLPVQQRRVVKMDLLEKSSAEIAASLQITEGCVRGYRAKALASLRKMLGAL
ncbi:sigma-70 family RNA polymerase sigma factor [Dinghuibacter silviterrae]|uniref:RNA polymerase sigma factor (Sigma-70 family) n=1 Tax=Dinghuibacter silviterrae TaxID=1539049 RepID=A0A4R8DHE3_9BACT|nr:sigma-70 family RNA polymerase sigma factor [Dinghuibacter silviterrae]TDW96848.1 RNA polymerase sigma factor (sigma-70 family) [Dinghuibacter silviterrae]